MLAARPRRLPGDQKTVSHGFTLEKIRGSITTFWGSNKLTHFVAGAALSQGQVQISGQFDAGAALSQAVKTKMQRNQHAKREREREHVVAQFSEQ